MALATSQVTPRIVVGIDGSSASKEALWWACQEAVVRQATVDAVAAWQPQEGMMPPADSSELLEKAAREVVDDAVREAEVAVKRDGLRIVVSVLESDAVREPEGAAKRDEVRVGIVVRRGDPAFVLLGRAKDADLLVVGIRGHNRFAEAALGSVGLRVVQRAACPVVIMRERVAGGMSSGA